MIFVGRFSFYTGGRDIDVERIAKLSRGLELALNQEWPGLEQACQKAIERPVFPIGESDYDNRRLVATVATDGGEGRLSLEPIRIDVIRVADSEGKIHFEQFIPKSLSPEEIIRFCIAGEESLMRLFMYLGVSRRDFLPNTEYQKSNLVAMIRETMEWGATLKLAWDKQPKLIVRDGLLRSVLLPEKVFNAFEEKLVEMTAKNNHILIGVAKRSAVISYLSVAFGIKKPFKGGRPAYLPVGEELEREAAPSQYRWVNQRCMGNLHIAKLDAGESIPLLPVDIAKWQEDKTKEAMSLLSRASRKSFPIRGYPQELMSAHEYAKLNSFETEILESLLLENLRGKNPEIARQVRELKLLGRRLVEEINDEA